VRLNETRKSFAIQKWLIYSFVVPTISTFRGIKIFMYYREHAPPHFHAERADEEAEVGEDEIR
jgi:hypothetical protein